MSSSPFPSELESIAASALLMLSNTHPSPLTSREDSPPPVFCFDDNSKESIEGSVSRNQKSFSSSLTLDDSFVEFQDDSQQRIINVVARCHEIKLKVTKKSRSKTYWGSNWLKTSPDNPETVAPGCKSENTEGCLSRTGSPGGISSDLSYCDTGEKVSASAVRNQKSSRSSHLQRRADDILNLLCDGCASEVKIRQLLGDSPDTSKALRRLLKLEQVKRSGAGGRGDPYIYTIARSATH